MSTKLQQAFLNAKYQAMKSLPENIWQKLLKRNKRFVILKMWGYSLMGVASLIGLISALKILVQDIAKSGFYEYLSLASANLKSISIYWKELSFSLAESLPLSSILLSLSLAFVFLFSLRYLLRQANSSQLRLSFRI